MSYEVRTLGERDNDALLALASSSNTGSEAFRVDRAPDFFALARFFGEAAYLGVFDRDLLVGCVGLTNERRYLGGEPAELVYAHDLRVHPRYRATRAIAALLGAAAEACRGRRAFATVLDGSPHRASFERRLGRFVGVPSALGRTIHLGAPVFSPPKPLPGVEVRPLAADQAIEAYRRIATRHAFAPADLARFAHADGEFLGALRRGRVVAVSMLLDQSRARRIVADSLGRAFSLLRLLARARGSAPMPRRGEELRIAYLALYASEDDAPYDASFVAHARATSPRRFTYVFRGMSEAEATTRSFGPFAIRLSSTTYGFGRWAEGLSLGYHELTLV